MGAEDDRDLAWGLGRIGYELWMCVECVGRRLAADRDGDQVAMNAFLESLLLHARVLIDFFLGQANPRDDDMLRGEFTVDWQVLPEAKKRLEGWKVEFNKRLVHLTWEGRDDPTKKAWDYGLMACLLVELVADWQQTMAPDLAATLTPNLQKCKDLLKINTG